MIVFCTTRLLGTEASLKRQSADDSVLMDTSLNVSMCNASVLWKAVKVSDVRLGSSYLHIVACLYRIYKYTYIFVIIFICFRYTFHLLGGGGSKELVKLL